MPTNMAEYSTVTTTIVRTVVFCPTFILHYCALYASKYHMNKNPIRLFHCLFLTCIF